MKLGVSYNLFDGEELLLYSIQSIRSHVDYINVVYQIISNHGNRANDDLEDLLQTFLKKKLIDELYFYDPNLDLGPDQNEARKRNIGLQLAKYNNCTHFMNIDVDEFYDADQFKFAKQYIDDNKIGCSAAGIVSYIKEPIYGIEGFRNAYVPFICEIDSSSEIKINTFFPVLVDPTRRFSGDKRFHLFDTNSIVMHHMGLVRRDIEKKFINSTSAFAKSVQMLRENTLNWKYGNTFRYNDDAPELLVSKVENKFNIDINDSQWKKFTDVSIPKVLITNHHLMDYAGSEITVLETVIVLKELGFDISVATFSCENPMKAEFEKNNINVFNILKEKLPFEDYDIAWCHHASVLSHIINSGVRIKKVIFRTLSPIHPLEALPCFVKDIDIVLANSAETAERFYSDGWIDKHKIDVFPNSVPMSFFIQSKQLHRDKIEKVVIVSNHVPNELLEAASILKNNFIDIDIIGLTNEYQFIKPEVLLPYDVVVTIGKTVQYCFALKIPVFCYDYFGGPGYISDINFEKAEHYNFSGRCCRRQLKADVLASEIISGYKEALKKLDQLRSIADERYNLKENIKKILSLLERVKINKVFYQSDFSKELKMQLVHNEFYVEVLKRAYALDKFLFLTDEQKKIKQEKLSSLPGELTDCKKELNHLFGSHSWRYTAPFRKIGSVIRRILK
jgi:hypothetical protein